VGEEAARWLVDPGRATHLLLLCFSVSEDWCRRDAFPYVGVRKGNGSDPRAECGSSFDVDARDARVVSGE
jgi:hypothetical protein